MPVDANEGMFGDQILPARFLPLGLRVILHVHEILRRVMFVRFPEEAAVCPEVFTDMGHFWVGGKECLLLWVPL